MLNMFFFQILIIVYIFNGNDIITSSFWITKECLQRMARVCMNFHLQFLNFLVLFACYSFIPMSLSCVHFTQNLRTLQLFKCIKVNLGGHYYEICCFYRCTHFSLPFLVVFNYCFFHSFIFLKQSLPLGSKMSQWLHFHRDCFLMHLTLH